MNSTATKDRTDLEVGAKDQLVHYHCGRCFIAAQLAGVPSTALCGARQKSWAVTGGDDGACIVCRDYLANEVPCAVCGLIPRKGIPT